MDVLCSSSATDICNAGDIHEVTCKTKKPDMASALLDPAADLSRAGWQVGKSVLDVNKHMLESQLRTDVTFKLMTAEGGTREMGGHSYVLTSRSPVFEAMLSGRWLSEDNFVEIDDVSDDVFEEFLKYVYCEQCEIDANNVLPLLYTARKYIISPLVTLCSDYVETNMTSENVCTIYQRALEFGARDLQDRCWTFIYSHAESVFKGNDVINLGEEALLKACVRWGRAHCLARDKEDTDPSVRSALGPVLHKLRLSCLTSPQLGELLGDSEVVTDDEKGRLYTYTVTGKGKSKLDYPYSARTYAAQRVNRFVSMNAQTCSTKNQAKLDAIKLSVDTDVTLLGVSIKASQALSIPPGILKITGPEGEVICQRVRAAKGSASYDVMVLPTTLQAGVEYRLCVDWMWEGAKHLNYQFSAHYLGSNKVKLDNVMFSFFNSSETSSSSSVTFGQFQHLLYDIIK